MRKRRTQRRKLSLWFGAAALVVIGLPIYTNATAHHLQSGSGQSGQPETVAPQQTSAPAAPNTQVGNAASTGKQAGSTSAAGGNGGATAGLSPTGSNASTASLVEQAFQATNAKMSASEVHSWVMVNHKFESVQQLSTIAKEIEQEFPLQQAKSVVRTDKSENFYELYGQRGSYGTASIVASSFQFPNAPSQTILIVRDDSNRPNSAQLTADYKQIAQAQRQLGLSPEISACIKGFTSVRISGGLIPAFENRVFQAVHAKRVEGINTQNVTSISGYSPLFANYITTSDQRKMNVELGLHYDTLNRATEVIVGAPYITITY